MMTAAAEIQKSEQHSNTYAGLLNLRNIAEPVVLEVFAPRVAMTESGR